MDNNWDKYDCTTKFAFGDNGIILIYESTLFGKREFCLEWKDTIADRLK